MIALTLFSAYESEPLKIYHGFSFFFLRAVFLLSFSKEGRKMRFFNINNYYRKSNYKYHIFQEGNIQNDG